MSLSGILHNCRRLATDRVAREAAWNNLLKEMSYTHHLTRSLGHPQVMEIETTNRCPFTCVMCPRTYAMTRATGDMDFELFRDIVDQIRPAWQMDKISGKPIMRLVHFGEPFVYHHFFEAIAHCHRRQFHVFISSNPSVWTDRRIEEVLDSGLDELMAMVDGMDDDTSMAIRGKAAGFNRAEANLRKLADLKAKKGLSKPFLVVAMIRQPRNLTQWEAFDAYWKSIEGIDATYLGYLSTFNGYVEEINKLNETLIRENAAQAKQVCYQNRLSRYPCYYPWHSVCVTWQGDVVPCCRDLNATIVFGNLKEKSLNDIWNSPVAQDLREQFVRGSRDNLLCRRCAEGSLETGLPGRHYWIARLMRQWKIGRMYRVVADTTLHDKNLSGAQNISDGGYRKTK